MDWTWLVAAAVAVVAVAEMIQVIILNYSVSKINKKLALIIPEGKSADQILSDTVYTFMAELQSEPKKAEIIGGFIRGSAEAAYDQVAKKIPMLRGAEVANAQMEKLASKNPWVGLGLGVAQALAPMAKEAMENRKGGGNTTGSGSKGVF